MQGQDNVVDGRVFDYPRSVYVERGVWVLYKEKNYKGDICVVMEGDKTNFEQSDNEETETFKFYDFKNSVSSLKPIVDDDFTEDPKCTVHKNYFDDDSLELTEDISELGSMKGKVSSITKPKKIIKQPKDFTQEPKCTVYEHDFGGRSLEFTEDILDMRWYKMDNKVSSIRVHSGVWVGFEDVDFKGKMTLYLPGDHNSKSTDGIYRNDTLSSLRALQIKPSIPVIVDKIDFHQKQELPVGKRIGLLSWTQSNNTDVTQKLSVKKKHVKTEDTYEFRWEKETRIAAEYSFKTLIPIIGYSYQYNMERVYNIGSSERTKTANSETWSVHYPSDIPSKSKITLTSYLVKGKVDVPFTAHIHQGDEKWTEKGTFKEKNKIMSEKAEKKRKITLYEHVNFKGRSITFTEANDNLIDQGFNDYSSSVIVEGEYYIISNKIAIRISRHIPFQDFTEKPKCTVYAAANFKGRSLEFTDDILDLGWWVGYDQPNFRGAAHSLFLTGDHSMSSTLGGFRNDRLRSLRALQIVCFANTLQITLTSQLTQGKVDVPFTATLHQGNKRWMKTGIFSGTHYYGLVTEFKEEPI
ncbi:CRYB [Mytilus edulis]|uniref:CRYB n=1 Tax=Mytilus edulis TaxID=6550 RepID=A0A8S3RWU1_MYTED|nr:CRYB [Mytilus edulis]